MSDQSKTTAPRWVEHDPTFLSLMLGRIELAQISKGAASRHWFYTLRFTVAGERAGYSCPSMPEAQAVCETHARKVLEKMPSDPQTTDPQAVALSLYARLQNAVEHGKAMRDVVASIADQPGSERTIRAELRLLVRAYDEGISHV